MRTLVAGIAILCLLGAAACGSSASTSGLGSAPMPASGSLWGFTAPWDSTRDSSVRADAPYLDAIMSSSFQLDSLTGQPIQRYSDDSTRPLATPAHIALVTTLAGDRYHPEAVRALASNASALNLAASRLAALIARDGSGAAVLDFEAQPAADVPSTLGVIRTIADSLHAHGVRVAVEIPGADTAAYPTTSFAAAADLLVVALYDEHWPTSAPGPIASPEWVRRTLARRVADVGGTRVVAVLPVFSYLWRANQPAQMLGFDDARRVAAEASAEITRDPTSQSLHAVQPERWELWMSDRESLRALEREVRSLGVDRIALWRIGLEDGGIWASRRRGR